MYVFLRSLWGHYSLYNMSPTLLQISCTIWWESPVKMKAGNNTRQNKATVVLDWSYVKYYNKISLWENFILIIYIYFVWTEQLWVHTWDVILGIDLSKFHICLWEPICNMHDKRIGRKFYLPLLFYSWTSKFHHSHKKGHWFKPIPCWHM